MHAGGIVRVQRRQQSNTTPAAAVMMMPPPISQAQQQQYQSQASLKMTACCRILCPRESNPGLQ